MSEKGTFLIVQRRIRDCRGASPFIHWMNISPFGTFRFPTEINRPDTSVPIDTVSSLGADHQDGDLSLASDFTHHSLLHMGVAPPL